MTLRLSPSVSGEEHVRALGPGASQHVLVRAVAADGLPAERRRQPVERGGRDVQDHDLVAGPVELVGQGRAHATAADDDGFHASSSGIGSRTTHTAHGAFFST